MHKLFLIGLGKRGLVHADLLSLRQDAVIVGGYDHSIVALENCRKNHSFSLFQNLKQGLELTQPNFILISTPPHVRSDLFPFFDSLDSLMGLMIEKPLALSIEEAFKISQICLDNSWKLSVIYQSRFCDEFIALKEVITEGRLGKLLFIKSACYGNLYNQGSHMIDLIRWLADEQKIKWVDATGNNNQKKISELTTIPTHYQYDEMHPGHLWSSITMRLESDIEVFLTCGLLDAYPLPALGHWLQRRITVVGEKGVAHAHLSSHFMEISSTPPYKKNYFTSKEKYFRSLQSLYDHVFGAQATSVTHQQQEIDNYLFTQAAIQAALISAKNHEIVRIPLNKCDLINLGENQDNNKQQVGNENLVISVIVPMETHRGIAEEAVLSWVANQRCEKDVYEVILVFYKKQKELIQKIGHTLGFVNQEWFNNGEEVVSFITKVGTRIKIASIDGKNEIELCHYGATLAEGKYLVFTESHCIAEAQAVQQAINFFKVEKHDGFYPRTEAICKNSLSRFELRLYNLGVSEFDNPQCWAKITLHAFGIKKDVYLAIGGFAYQYNRFAYWILGADFHRMGYSLGYAPGVGVEHVFVNDFAELNQFLTECVVGEVDFRLAENHKNNYDAYFSKPKDWIHIQKYNPELSKIIFLNCLFLLFSEGKKLRDFSFWMNLYTAFTYYMFPKSYFLVRYKSPRLFNKFCFLFSRKKNEFAWTNFYNYCLNTFTWYRVKFFLDRKQIAQKMKAKVLTHYPIQHANEVDLYGFHEPEIYQEKSFRWTQKVSGMRIYLTPELSRIRIKLLNGIRPANSSEINLFINRNKVKKFELNDSQDEIIFELPKRYSAKDEGYWLVVFAKPWYIKNKDLTKENIDTRLLGFPIREVCLE